MSNDPDFMANSMTSSEYQPLTLNTALVVNSDSATDNTTDNVIYIPVNISTVTIKKYSNV